MTLYSDVCQGSFSICNDVQYKRLVYMYITDTEDLQVGSFLISYHCTLIYFVFLDLCTLIFSEICILLICNLVPKLDTQNYNLIE